MCKTESNWKSVRNLENLPECFLDSCASIEAKQVMGALLHLATSYSKAGEKGFLVASNMQLYEATGMKKSRVMDGIEELEAYGLIERNAGVKREKGKKGTASSYYFNIEKMFQPLVRREKISDDELKAKYSFLTPSKPASPKVGAAISNTTSTSNTISNNIFDIPVTSGAPSGAPNDFNDNILDNNPGISGNAIPDGIPNDINDKPGDTSDVYIEEYGKPYTDEVLMSYPDDFFAEMYIKIINRDKERTFGKNVIDRFGELLKNKPDMVACYA